MLGVTVDVVEAIGLRVSAEESEIRLWRAPLPVLPYSLCDQVDREWETEVEGERIPELIDEPVEPVEPVELAECETVLVHPEELLETGFLFKEVAEEDVEEEVEIADADVEVETNADV